MGGIFVGGIFVGGIFSPTPVFGTVGAEHGGRSHRTGRRLQNEPHCNIRSHCEQVCHAPVSISNFSILDSSNSNVSLRILKSLFIFKNKPKLNQNDSAFPLKIVT